MPGDFLTNDTSIIFNTSDFAYDCTYTNVGADATEIKVLLFDDDISIATNTGQMEINTDGMIMAAYADIEGIKQSATFEISGKGTWKCMSPPTSTSNYYARIGVNRSA